MVAVLRSLLAIGIILGMVGGTAFAVFTDESTDTSNLGSGKVDISMPDHGDWSMDVDHLVPGQQAAKTIVIRNAGNVDFDWTAHQETTGAIFEGATPVAATYDPSQGMLHPGETQGVDVTVKLPAEAGNDYQSKSGKLTLRFEAANTAP